MPEPAARLVDISLPALLRAARTAYASAIRAALSEVDCADLPTNGPYVLSAIVRMGPQMARIVQQLGVSKQAAGQLVEALVQRGYLIRDADPADRRRFTLALSERGSTAAKAVRSAVARLDAALEQQAGTDAVQQTRHTLRLLAQLTTTRPTASEPTLPG